MMSFHSFSLYVRSAVPDVPWEHWVVMGVVTLAVVLWGRISKKYSIYGTIFLGLAVLFALYLLEATVFVRIGRDNNVYSGLDLKGEYRRLVDGYIGTQMMMLFNVLVFIPFGFALSEFLCSTRFIRAKRCLGIVSLAGFALSLTRECFEWLFKVGMFEITDMVLNTLGAFLGATISLAVRELFRQFRSGKKV